MVTIAGYGSWDSPVSVDDVTGATVGLVGGTLDGGDVWWVESHASQGGRASLWRRSADGEPVEVTPDHYVRSTVHEYGGGAWAVLDGVAVFSHFPTNVVHVAEAGRVRPITPEGPMRYGGFALVPGARRVVCVREDHSADDAECTNTLVVLDLDSDNADGGRVVAAGADFYGQPTVRGDGALAWCEWDHPHMPWDSTRVLVGSLDGGAVPRQVAGGDVVSAVCPAWDGDGTLVLLSDASGFWNLHRWDGELRALHDHPYDFCGPQWVLGGAPYALLPGGRVGCAWYQDGRARLGVLAADGTLRDLGLDLADARVQGGEGGRAVVSLAYADRPAELAVVDWGTGALVTVRRASDRVCEPGWVSRPRQITWEGPDGPVHAWYHPPTNPDHAAPDGELPPVVVLSHGGPTGFSPGSFSWAGQFWTSRGIGLLDVNYGGSAGYGRAYRERLKGRWGVVDVRDCVDAARAAVEQGLADPARLAIRGGSAGGYTTLQALVTSDVFGAGISLYGVGDLETLAADTHKFESRYLDALIGPYPQARDVYLARSPIHHLDRLSTPMLVLQGTDDKVVPPDQALAMADAVRGKGLPVALVMLEGEGHGFRRADSIRRSLEAQLSFLGQVFGFEPSGDVPVLTVDNLDRPAG